MNAGKYTRVFPCLAFSGLLLVGLFLILGGAPQTARANPGNKFVTYAGDGDCSQASPCDLQTALAAAQDGDAIYIAAGTYSGSGGAVMTITHSIAVYGGWNGSLTFPPVLNPASNRVTIDGANTRRGVYVGNGLTVTLDGLTITNGKYVGTSYRGAGLYARYANLTLRQMTFYRNIINLNAIPGNEAWGGGAMVSGGTLLVDSSTFQENNARGVTSYGGGLVISYTTAATVTNSLFQDNDSWWGGGLYFWGSPGPKMPFTLRDSTFIGNGRGISPGGGSGSGYVAAVLVATAKARLERNTIRDNSAIGDYGALRISSSDVLLSRNTITSNECARTSGLYLYYASPFTATNNIIAGNVSTDNSIKNNPAVLVLGGNGKFLNNTIADNASNYGVLVSTGGNVALTNTIIVSNTLGISVTAGSTAALQGTLWGSGDWANDKDWGGAGTIATGTVNIWGNPAFVDPDAYDYHIGAKSAAKDVGVAAGVIDDIDGEPRPFGPGFDIGADEFINYVYLPVVRKN